MLQGIRVLEFGNLIAAPYAAMLLADLGADVIKVEPPQGDLARSFGPFRNGESVFFLAVNRGKRSVVVDTRTEEGRRTALRLCATADVLVHNLRPGAMERRGLSYADVARMNPGVVYVAISAFGPDGPYAHRTGIDVVFQGESGMMSITGEPGSPPGKTATTIGDYVAGTNAALLACAALVSRSTTGEGAKIDVILRDGLVAVQSGWNALAAHLGTQPEKTGTASPFLAPNQVFPTADGWMTIGVVADAHFRRLCEAIDLPELAERYPTNELRMRHREQLAELLSRRLREHPTEHWLEKISPTGVPVGRVLTLPQVWEDPQVVHNRLVFDYLHPVAGPVKGIGAPWRIGDRSTTSRLPPPGLGAHTSEVLDQLDR